MPPKIAKYPHAEYNDEELNGSLCDYYGWLSIEQNLWRNQTYSPEVLNYKDGEEAAIKYFVPGYLKLIEHVLAEHEANYAYVVPVPASVPASSADFTTKPKSVTGRNRDNRNQVFCKLLHDGHDKVILTDVLMRTDPKPKKARWSPEQHADSMVIKGKAESFDEDDLLILVDDVSTQGGTINGAKLLLSNKYDADRIITLPISQTRFSAVFRPLRPPQS